MVLRALKMRKHSESSKTMIDSQSENQKAKASGRAAQTARPMWPNHIRSLRPSKLGKRRAEKTKESPKHFPLPRKSQRNNPPDSPFGRAAQTARANVARTLRLGKRRRKGRKIQVSEPFRRNKGEKERAEKAKQNQKHPPLLQKSQPPHSKLLPLRAFTRRLDQIWGFILEFERKWLVLKS